MVEHNQRMPVFLENIDKPERNWAPYLALGFLATTFVCMGMLVSTMAYVGLYQIRQPKTEIAAALPTIEKGPTATPLPPNLFQNEVLAVNNILPTPTLRVVNADEPAEAPPVAAQVVAPPGVLQQSVSQPVESSLDRLLNTDLPPRDYYESHVRLGNTTLERYVPAPIAYQQGDIQTINVFGDQVSIRLVAVTESSYLWFDTALNYSAAEINEVANQVEYRFLPPIVDLFGKPWTPGIDLDDKINIVHLYDTDSRELGYFDSSDEYPRAIFSQSNEHEAIYLNMAELALGTDFYYGTLVHELQHLIQWNSDKNEETWLDEGLSQLAEVYSGLDSFSVDDYTHHHAIQLNTWSYDQADVYSHYSGSALFFIYLYEQLGVDAIRTLATHRLDGMAAVKQVVEQNRPFDTFFSDWLVALYLNGWSDNARHRIAFQFAPITPDYVVSGNQLAERTELAQYSARYIQFNNDPGQTGSQTVNLSFIGDSVRQLFPPPPHSETEFGSHAWFAPPANKLNAQLTREFDLTAIDQPMLAFETWFDLEQDYDFAYLLVSTDNGESWTPLNTLYSSNSLYGPGLSGRSAAMLNQNNGWVTESVPLQKYAGKVIQLRFEVITDSTNPMGGFAVDNIRIGNLYFDNAEDAGSGWVESGFVRSTPIIPQEWSLQLIRTGNGTTVERLELDTLNRNNWTLTVDGPTTLIIAPMAPFTTVPGSYQLTLSPLP